MAVVAKAARQEFLEEEKDMTTLAQRVLKWKAEFRREGRREGLQAGRQEGIRQGLAAERTLLSRQESADASCTQAG